eukprot:TRINITY_DN36752_c0_g1_i1.p1 TRINITY_DN36752_c0_g1~~TRINITY_DN36752_c0_g1_i1.p1  ORF type:complete len:1033 (+),score=228.36 TRINITY_DN36752_c0_g1_i1:229-3327(+)
MVKDGSSPVAAHASSGTAADELRRFLEDSTGTSLKAWLVHFDTDNDQRISKAEFCRGMRELNYKGTAWQLFAVLDEDGSGELTLDEVDRAQAEVWHGFRTWCCTTFKSPEEMLTSIIATRATEEEGKKTSRRGIAEKLQVDQELFRSGIQKIGWTLGFEDLLFDALDASSDGSISVGDMRWLSIELARQKRKALAKSKTQVNSRVFNPADAWRTQEQFQDFKKYLKRKHGNLVRAWRVDLVTGDSMILPKTQFLKACARLGFSGQGKELWKCLDKDDSGFASIDEFDLKSGEVLAYFRNFIIEKFGTVAATFNTLDQARKQKISLAKFQEAMQKLGFPHPSKKLFHILDKTGSKYIEEADIKFLDRWQPLEFLTASKNDAARDEMKALLCRKLGRPLKAWRHVLDRDGSNRCNWDEFKAACKTIGYRGDVAGAWRALDDDLSGFITLEEIDSDASNTLLDFRSWAWQEFGSVRSAFSVFDSDGSGSLSFQEFRGSLRIYGYNGIARTLFSALDVGGEGTLSMGEVAFLDAWEINPSKAEQQARKSKAALKSPIEAPEELQTGTSKQHSSSQTHLSPNASLESLKRSASKKLFKTKVEDPMRLVRVIRRQLELKKNAGNAPCNTSSYQRLPAIGKSTNAEDKGAISAAEAAAHFDDGARTAGADSENKTVGGPLGVAATTTSAAATPSNSAHGPDTTLVDSSQRSGTAEALVDPDLDPDPDSPPGNIVGSNVEGSVAEGSGIKTEAAEVEVEASAAKATEDPRGGAKRGSGLLKLKKDLKKEWTDLQNEHDWDSKLMNSKVVQQFVQQQHSASGAEQGERVFPWFGFGDEDDDIDVVDLGGIAEAEMISSSSAVGSSAVDSVTGDGGEAQAAHVNHSSPHGSPIMWLSPNQASTANGEPWDFGAERSENLPPVNQEAETAPSGLWPEKPALDEGQCHSARQHRQRHRSGRRRKDVFGDFSKGEKPGKLEKKTLPTLDDLLRIPNVGPMTICLDHSYERRNARKKIMVAGQLVPVASSKRLPALETPRMPMSAR